MGHPFSDPEGQRKPFDVKIIGIGNDVELVPPLPKEATGRRCTFKQWPLATGQPPQLVASKAQNRVRIIFQATTAAVIISESLADALAGIGASIGASASAVWEIHHDGEIWATTGAANAGFSVTQEFRVND